MLLTKTDTKLPVNFHKDENAHHIPMFLGKYNKTIYFISFFIPLKIFEKYSFWANSYWNFHYITVE